MINNPCTASSWPTNAILSANSEQLFHFDELTPFNVVNELLDKMLWLLGTATFLAAGDSNIPGCLEIIASHCDCVSCEGSATQQMLYIPMCSPGNTWYRHWCESRSIPNVALDRGCTCTPLSLHSILFYQQGRFQVLSEKGGLRSIII